MPKDLISKDAAQGKQAPSQAKFGEPVQAPEQTLAPPMPENQLYKHTINQPLSTFEGERRREKRMPRALITGATGLLGRAVLSAFESAGYETTGTGFSRASANILKLDIRDAQAVNKVFDEVK